MSNGQFNWSVAKKTFGAVFIAIATFFPGGFTSQLAYNLNKLPTTTTRVQAESFDTAILVSAALIAVLAAGLLGWLNRDEA
jgi:hypothetical protein